MDFCINQVNNKDPSRSTEASAFTRYDKSRKIGGWEVAWSDSGNSEVLQDKSESLTLAIGTLLGPLRHSSGIADQNPEVLGWDALSSNGSFVLVVVTPEQISLVTDAGGSIPIYRRNGPNGLALGTLVHHVAKLSGKEALDEISVVDYLIHGAICYPYTWYENVRLVPPGSVCTFTPEELDAHTWWKPEEPQNIYSTCDEEAWGERLRSAVKHAVEGSVKDKSKARVLFSGGEDARGVASLIPDGVDCTCTIVLDFKNREYRFAKRAARLLGHTFDWVPRPESYYRSRLMERVDNVGPGWDVRQIHIHGSVAEHVKDANVLLGGYLADTFFKTDYMTNVVRLPGKQEKCVIPDPDHILKVSRGNKHWVRDELIAEMHERRKEHHERLKSLRPRTAGNWHFLWPLSNMRSYPHYLACLRIGPRMIEPFLFNRTYRLAACMPDPCRLNRGAFRAAFARGMGAAGWFPTSAGRVLSLRGRTGRLALGVCRRAINLTAALIPGRGKLGDPREGPWGTEHHGWDDVNPAHYFSPPQEKKLEDRLSGLFKDGYTQDFFRDERIGEDKKVRVLSLAF